MSTTTTFESINYQSLNDARHFCFILTHSNVIASCAHRAYTDVNGHAHDRGGFFKVKVNHIVYHHHTIVDCDWLILLLTEHSVLLISPVNHRWMVHYSIDAFYKAKHQWSKWRFGAPVEFTGETKIALKPI